MTYQQQRQYFTTKKKDLTSLLVLFRKHLVKQIKEWRKAGERIILFMDHNKHVINGPLGKQLADKEGLDLHEAIVQHRGTSPGATFFCGSKPIDGMWVSSNLEISNTCMMLFGYGIGDHRTFILDIPIESLVGVDPVKIVWPVGRRLNSRLPGCSQLYINSLKRNITRHQLLERLFEAHTGNYSDEERAHRVTIIEKEGKAYMWRAEKICRKIKCCQIPFSPKAAIWIRRVQVYYSLLRYHKGRIKIAAIWNVQLGNAIYPTLSNCQSRKSHTDLRRARRNSYSTRNMANASDRSISKIERRSLKNKTMKKHSTRSAP
jgi:hypothetical protein